MRRPAKPRSARSTAGKTGGVGAAKPTLLRKCLALEKEIGQLASQVPFGLHTQDPDGTFLTVNAQELSWLGYTRQELIDKIRFPELLTYDSRQRYAAALARLSPANAIVNAGIVLVGKNGLALPINLSVKAISGADGKALRHLCLLFNDGDRAQTEERLRIAATVFQSIEGMMVTDCNGIILNVNRAFTAITGYSADEVIGRRPSVLSSGRHDKGFFAAMWADLARKGAWTGEIWNRRKDGEIYPEHLTITAVSSPEGVVTNYVGTFVDITESKVAIEKIEHLAFYDPLTGLPNRRLLIERLQHAPNSSARNGMSIGILYIDLDDFKNVNNTLGHDTGDQLLRQVGERLSSCVRKGDTVARLGGDEFVVVLENLSEQKLKAASQAEVIGQKILATLNHPYTLGKHEVHNSPSVGATLLHDGEKAVEDVLKQADIAMYQAKKAGRNTIRFFDPLMQISIDARAKLEFELHRAIESGQFELYYQIQVSGTSHPLGAECLIRWLHPVHGMIAPDQFVPLAEETGMILPIGLWVLETACARLEEWEADPSTRNLVLSVNVSARQLRQKTFVDQVRDAIRRHHINPQRLQLEITESMLLEDIEDTIDKMDALQGDGIRFSLDDFGTGYSCLQYLKRLPLNQLKIDRSFIRNLATDASDQVIVGTIIAMATSLRLAVIAEGVETETQRKYLLDRGCRQYQGYLFGKPMPVKEFEASLKRESI